MVRRAAPDDGIGGMINDKMINDEVVAVYVLLFSLPLGGMFLEY